MAQGEHIIPIPGTQHEEFAFENAQAAEIVLSAKILQKLDYLINPNRVKGLRYSEEILATMET